MACRRISNLLPPRGSFERKLVSIAACIITLPLVFLLGIAARWLSKYRQLRQELARIATQASRLGRTVPSPTEPRGLPRA